MVLVSRKGKGPSSIYIYVEKMDWHLTRIVEQINTKDLNMLQ